MSEAVAALFLAGQDWCRAYILWQMGAEDRCRSRLNHRCKSGTGIAHQLPDAEEYQGDHMLSRQDDNGDRLPLGYRLVGDSGGNPA